MEKYLHISNICSNFAAEMRTLSSMFNFTTPPCCEWQEGKENQSICNVLGGAHLL